MRFRYLLGLFLSLIILTESRAQCPGSLECSGSQVFCAINTLNGFRCSNPTMPNSGFPLGSLCRGAGAPHNINWWAFVGSGGPLNLTFNFDINNCVDNMGIQAGVFEGNCDGTRIWDCNAACNTSTFTLSGVTIACEIYYVWVDGCNGDVCDYTMSVAGNGQAPRLPKPIPPPVAQGPLCVCGTTEFCFPGVPGACEPVTTWTVDGMPAGVQGDDCIEVEFPDQSPRTICVTATIGNPLDPNAICDDDVSCITVAPPPIQTLLGPLRTLCTRNDPFIWHGMPITSSCVNPPCSARIQRADGCCVDSLVPFQILPPEIRVGLPRTICPEDQPFVWQGTTITTSCVNPPCTARVEGPDGCLIDSIRSFTLLPPRLEGRLDTFFCSIPPNGYRTEDNQVFRDETCNEPITFQDPVFGCDTTYNLNIRVFKYAVNWEADCFPCDGAVTLCPNIEYDPDCPEFNDGRLQITIDWINQRGQMIATTQGNGCQRFTEPGRICVNLNVSYLGRPCPGMWQECYTIPEGLFPEKPEINGDSSVCGSVPGLYYTNIDEDDVCEFDWRITTPGGVIRTNNAFQSDSVLVDWTNAVGDSGIICVSYTNDCGTSEDTCFVVDFSGSPQINAGPDTNICASVYTMQGIEDVGGEWTQVGGPGSADINDPTNINTDVNVTDYGEYRFIWSETRDQCTSVDTVTIGFRPDPAAANFDTICNGDATAFTVTFELMSGTAPYTVISGGGSVDMNNVYTSDEIADNTPTTIVIQDTFGCEYTYFIDHNCECRNSVGEIEQDTLAFCGTDDEACADYDPSGQVLVPGVDTFMFVLYSQQGMLQASEIARNQTGCFSFDPMTMNTGQVYYIGVAVGMKDGNGTVDLDGGCLQLEEAQPVIWYAQPEPDAGQDDEVCGEVYNLSAAQSLPGSSIRWLNTQGVVLDDPDQLNTNATIQQGQHGTYNIIVEETNAICTVRDTVAITFFEVPEATNAREICVDSINRQNYDYIVCFNITKGTPPYTIVQGGGSIDPMNNRYCSDQMMSLTVYDIIIEDANGCQFSITGDHNCDCGATDPGTMDQAQLSTCVDLCVDIETNGTETLEADDVAEFVLHEGSGALIINEIVRYPYDPDANPAEIIQFCFDATAGMVPGRVYYISRLVRSATDPEDPCERIAPGQPVVWNSYPQSDAGTNQDVCGLTATLEALPSIGTGEWSIADQPPGSNVMLTPGMATNMVTVDQYGTYTFQWKEDNEGCADSSTVNVTFHDAPRITNIFFQCDDVAENYVVYIEVAGGDLGSYEISGVPLDRFSVNTFITQPIPTGTDISFCVTDQWDCAPACRDTTFECQCISEAGTITADDILCIDDCVQVGYQGGMEDGNDLVRYVLHDGDANNLGNVIACTDDGEFCFDAATMTANTQYFITALVGNDDGSNCVDLTDRCLAQSAGVPVTWFEYPQPDITSTVNTFTCQVDSLELDGSASAGPGTLTYEWTTTDGNFCPGTSTNGQTVWICSSGTYILTTTHAESGCATSDTIVIERDQNLPAVSAGSSQELTCDQTSVTLDATGSDFGGGFILEWLDPNMNVISTDLTVTVNQPGTYTVRVTNDMTDCEDERTVEVTQNIDRPTAVVDQIGMLTCTEELAELNAANSMTQGGVRSYEWSTTDGMINGSSNVANIEITEPGQYQLIVVDERNGCADTTVVEVIEIGNTLETVDVDPTDPSCFGSNDGLLEINVTGGIDPLQYSVNGGQFTTSNVFTNLAPGTYDVTVRDQNGCEKDTMVTITEPVEIDIIAKEDMIKEAGSSINLDTLIEQIFGTDIQNADSVYWYDAATGMRIPRSQIDSLKETTTFRVTVFDGPCQASDLITIFVRYTRNVFVPNIIFPGTDFADSDNAKLYVYGNADRIAAVNFMRVYDRWGEKIYSQDNIDYDEPRGRSVDGWDGTFNGERMNPGVYIYHIQVSFFDSDGGLITQDFFGDVTVMY